MNKKIRFFSSLVTVLFVLFAVQGLSAETENSTKAGLKLNISADVGGVFIGGDAELSGGIVGGLYVAPYKKFTIKNVNLQEYGTAISQSRYQGFTLPNFGYLSSNQLLSKNTDIMNRAEQLTKKFNDGKISKEEYDESIKKLDKEAEAVKDRLNAVVTESTYHRLNRISFGVLSGYYVTSYIGMIEEEDFFGNITEEEAFKSLSYIPLMGSFQHNFPLLGDMRHINTEVLIPYEEPKKLTWDYTNTQMYFFYRVSGGVGVALESDDIEEEYAPLMRFEIGIGSREGLFSFINTSIGYQKLFTSEKSGGTLFINWSMIVS